MDYGNNRKLSLDERMTLFDHCDRNQLPRQWRKVSSEGLMRVLEDVGHNQFKNNLQEAAHILEYLNIPKYFSELNETEWILVCEYNARVFANEHGAKSVRISDTSSVGVDEDVYLRYYGDDVNKEYVNVYEMDYLKIRSFTLGMHWSSVPYVHQQRSDLSDWAKESLDNLRNENYFPDWFLKVYRDDYEIRWGNAMKLDGYARRLSPWLDEDPKKGTILDNVSLYPYIEDLKKVMNHQRVLRHGIRPSISDLATEIHLAVLATPNPYIDSLLNDKKKKSIWKRIFSND